MRVQLLGSGHSAGVPAWNDGSESAFRARANDPNLPTREAAALALSADGIRYALLEAPLHLPSTLSRSERFAPRPGTRDTPIDSLVLTSTDLGACAGALGFADAASVRVVTPIGVGDALLADGSPFRALETSWSVLRWDRSVALDREERLEARFFPLPGPTPPHLRDSAPRAGRARCGVRVTDRETGARIVWAPRISKMDSACLAELRGADLRFVDGTYASNEELRAIRPGLHDFSEIGHTPIDGSDGSLAWLAGMQGESVYVHMASSNPACDQKSRESERIRAAGVELAFDGQEWSL